MINTPRYLSHLGLVLACVAFLGMSGGHWAVLQTTAWVRMFQDFSKETPLIEAVEKTFENRCSLCISVREGLAREKQTPEAVKFEVKHEILVAVSRAPVIPPPASPRRFPVFNPQCVSSGPPEPVEPVPRILVS